MTKCFVITEAIQTYLSIKFEDELNLLDLDNTTCYYMYGMDEARSCVDRLTDLR